MTAAAAAAAATKWAEVDIAALRDNTRALKAVAGDGTAVMAMVKANGYGHGAVFAGRAAIAGGATWLGVSSIAEAVELRRAGIGVAVLNVGWTAPAEMALAASSDIDIAVFDVDGVTAARAAATAAGRPIRVHWKLDTGMGRLGTRLDEVPSMVDALRAARELTVVALFTHFASADADDTDFALAQHARFVDTTTALREHFGGVLLHAANSPALLRLSQTHHDIVRPGIALYGYPPNGRAGTVLVRPALAVRALVTQVKRLLPGDTVGYGRTWTAARPSLVANVAAGYADGVDRRNGNNGAVIVGGALCPIVGRISMDQFGVDVSAAATVRAGDVATIIGEADGLVIDAVGVAARIGTISYEVLCAVSARVPRVAVHDEGVLP